MNKQPQQHSHLKQRVIGAIVLIALVVIFVPMLLQRSPTNIESIGQFTQRPSMSTPVAPDTASLGQVSNQNTDAVQPIAEAWVVQLGTFSNKHNANQLLKRLQANGFTSYQYQNKVANKTLIRVYVGPEVKKSEAQKLQQLLLQKMRLKGTLVPFNPLNS